MGAIAQQVKFAWAHLGRFRQVILVGCLAMTKFNDCLGWLPEGIKTRVGLVIPHWSWYWWVIIFLCLVVAFVIEESYSRQHAEGTGEEFSPNCGRVGNWCGFDN